MVGLDQLTAMRAASVATSRRRRRSAVVETGGGSNPSRPRPSLGCPLHRAAWASHDGHRAVGSGGRLRAGGGALALLTDLRSPAIAAGGWPDATPPGQTLSPGYGRWRRSRAAGSSPRRGGERDSAGALPIGRLGGDVCVSRRSQGDQGGTAVMVRYSRTRARRRPAGVSTVEQHWQGANLLLLAGGRWRCGATCRNGGGQRQLGRPERS